MFTINTVKSLNIERFFALVIRLLARFRRGLLKCLYSRCCHSKTLNKPTDWYSEKTYPFFDAVYGNPNRFFAFSMLYPRHMSANSPVTFRRPLSRKYAAPIALLIVPNGFSERHILFSVFRVSGFNIKVTTFFFHSALLLSFAGNPMSFPPISASPYRASPDNPL